MSWHNLLNSSGLGSGLGSGLSKFPSDFMFQLKNQDVISLRSQIVISNPPQKPKRKIGFRRD